MARRRFSEMQTEEQRYAAVQAATLRQQADKHTARAQAASREVLRDAWDGPITAAQVAPVRAARAEAERLRAQASQFEAEAKPKKKRGWW